MYKKKPIKTREELEMMNSGLIDVFNLPLTYQSKLIKYKDCRRTPREIIKGIHNQQVDEKFSKPMPKWEIQETEGTHNQVMCHRVKGDLEHFNTQEIQVQNKKAIITFTKEVQLTTSLINQNVLNNIGMETTEHMMLEGLWYKIKDRCV